MEYPDATDNAFPRPAYTSGPEPAVPRPLRIIKRVERNRHLKGRNTSNSSGYSINTEASRGSSVLDFPDRDPPLVVPKNRRAPRARLAPFRADCGSPPEEDEIPSPEADTQTTPTRRDYPQRAIPGYRTPRPLSTKPSRLVLDEDEKLIGPDISHFGRWALPSPMASRRTSSSGFDFSQREIAGHTRDVCLIAPKIAVTPEYTALDGGITRL